MKQALHRSITLWSGLLVMIFIVWACWDSTRNWSYVVHGRWELANIDCGLAVSRYHRPAPFGTERTEAIHVFEEKGLRMTLPRYFRKAAGESEAASAMRLAGTYGDDFRSATNFIFYHTSRGASGDWICYVPYWCLLAGIVPPWLGLLVWRGRRRKFTILGA